MVHSIMLVQEMLLRVMIIQFVFNLEEVASEVATFILFNFTYVANEVII